MFRREAETRSIASLRTPIFVIVCRDAMPRVSLPILGCDLWVYAARPRREASRLYDPSSLFLSLQIFSQGRAK